MKLNNFLLLVTLTLAPLFSQQKHHIQEAQNKVAILQNYLENRNQQITSFTGRNYDVTYYRLSLDMDPVSNYLLGSLQLNAKVKNEPLSAITVDFGNFLNVDSIIQNGINLNFTHDNALIDITLNATFNAGEKFSLTIYYQGSSDFEGSSFFGKSFGEISYAGKPLIWTISAPYSARDWWPCKDVLTDKPDSMDIFYTVPEGMTAVSNGRLMDTVIENNKSTFHWKLFYPIAPYLVCFNAYEFAEHKSEYISSTNDTLPISFFVTPDHFAASKENFDILDEYITIFSEIFGPYPFIKEKFAQVETPIFGGMENQTCVALGPVESSDGIYDSFLIAHELAHMWWGDMLTCASFQDMWLNEGFATYSEALITEALQGKDAYHDNMLLFRYFGGGTVFVSDTTDANRIYDFNLSYNKASWVLHMLRGVVGDSAFFQILKAWNDNPLSRFGSAYTADFIRIAEEISGKNLNKFFDQWIYGEYYPFYSYGFKSVQSADSYNITLFIDQVQTNADPFWMPIDVEVITETDTFNFVVWDSLSTQQFSFSVSDEPLEILIDPDNWILKKTREKLIEPDLDQGILLVNGVSWSNQLIDAYEAKAFWGNAPITFWDLFNEPAAGYPPTLPEPEGHGQISPEVFGSFSSIIWLSNNSLGDLDIWKAMPVIDYLNAGGNLILITRTGQLFIDDTMRNYLGITWDEQPQLLLKNCIATVDGLTDMELISNMAFNAFFDTVTTKETSTLIFKTNEGYEQSKGVGIRSNPANGGDFIYIAGRAWLFDYEDMQSNVIYMLENYFNEPVTGIDREIDINVPQTFAIKNIYPNPFNPSTNIEFVIPEKSTVKLAVYDITGKQVAVLINNQNLLQGEHKILWDADIFASGIYFIHLHANKTYITRKIVLMK